MMMIIMMCKNLPQLIVLQLLIATIDMRILAQPSMKTQHVSCTALLHTEQDLVMGLNG